MGKTRFHGDANIRQGRIGGAGRTSKRRLLAGLFALMLVPVAAIGYSPVSAATPGLPFTEDFSDTSLRDAAGTTANWDTDNDDRCISRMADSLSKCTYYRKCRRDHLAGLGI